MVQTPSASSPKTPEVEYPSSGSDGGPGAASSATPAFSPLYQQIKGLILQSLQAGEWK
ncbi:MAG: hypothetical protein RLZZ22_54, partial [Pseudomonadota bacterium]